MIFERLEQIRQSYRHVYLAPHLDDAALSCGGAIACLVDAGEPVLVVTFSTAAPAPGGPFSALAEQFHREWGLSPEAVLTTRLREETAALALLGPDTLWVGQLDAIYRRPDAYFAQERLFGLPAEDDPLRPAAAALILALRQRLPAARFYAPLGVGSHVDHLVVHQAAVDVLGVEVDFYEDFPYVAREGALQERLAQCALPLAATTLAIAAGLERKTAAISAYTSQLPELANSQLGRSVPRAEAARVFAEVVERYARQVGAGSPAERIWRRVLA